MKRRAKAFGTEDLVHIYDAAEELGVSRETFGRYLKNGKLTAIFVGARKYVRRADLDRFERPKRGHPFSPKAEPATPFIMTLTVEDLHRAQYGWAAGSRSDGGEQEITITRDQYYRHRRQLNAD